MNITPFSDSFGLCEYWLSNTKNNILNKEILNLQISCHSDLENNFEIVKNFIKNIMNESQEEILEDSRNCFATKLYTIYSNFINQIDICYEDNRNIIFITTMIPDFNKLDRPVLCVSLENYSLNLDYKFTNNSLNKEFLDNFINNVNNPKLRFTDYEKNSIHYIKILPLFELMKNKEYEKIAHLAYNLIMIEINTFILQELLQDTDYLTKSNFEKLILDDLEVLVTQKILVHRLSIVLYRLFLYKSNTSVFVIDKFFTQKLGFGVATDFYPDNLNFYVKNLNTYKTLKAYDLEGLEIIQLMTAREIIENQIYRYGNDIDKETIHEITHLSYEKIDELINTIKGYENDTK